MLTREQAQQAIYQIRDPELDRPLGDLDMIEELRVLEDGKVSLKIALRSPHSPAKEKLEPLVRQALKEAGASDVEIGWEVRVPSRPILPDDPIPEVKNVVLVMSGKGGVGKSTTAANLTMALHRAGYRVGLLDADMYGPSVPTMFGVMGRPRSVDGKRIEPLERFGVKLMSIGFLLETPTAAVVWRGPMLHGALMQFLGDVRWGKLDYLLLDLPPGTGDIALTISQKLRSTGAIIVTTPQEVALQDVYKSVSMCQKVGIPVLGVIENESYFICDGCQKRHELFGSGGGQKIAEFAHAPLLGQVPLDPSVRSWADGGTPIVQAAPGSTVAQTFVEIADRLVERIAELAQPQGLQIDRSGGSGPLHLKVVR